MQRRLVVRQMANKFNKQTNSCLFMMTSLFLPPLFPILGFFIPGFPKLLRFQEHHDKIMKKFLSKLKQHFVSKCQREYVDQGNCSQVKFLWHLIFILTFASIECHRKYNSWHHANLYRHRHIMGYE